MEDPDPGPSPKELLQRILTPQQWEDLHGQGHFAVMVEGTRYLICANFSGNVIQLDPDLATVHTYCVVMDTAFKPDIYEHLLMDYVCLTADRRRFLLTSP